jgi:hypothetical protein
MIDPERIQSGKDAVYVSFKGIRFYDKTPDQLLKNLPTAVKRQLGDDFFKRPGPVVTNVASQAAAQQAEKVSGAEAAQRTEGIAAKPRAPSFRFLTRRAQPAPRKGSVLNSQRKQNAAVAPTTTNKKPSTMNRFKAFGTTMKKGASSVASAAKKTGSAASSMFGKPRGYERVLNSNVQIPEKNPFTNPPADNMNTAVAPPTRATNKKPSAFNRFKAFGTTMKKGATAFGSAAKSGATALGSTAKTGLASVQSRFTRKNKPRVLRPGSVAAAPQPVATPKNSSDLNTDNPFA